MTRGQRGDTRWNYVVRQWAQQDGLDETAKVGYAWIG